MHNMYLALFAYKDPANRISLARAREPEGVSLPPPYPRPSSHARRYRAPTYHVIVKARLPRPGLPLEWTVERAPGTPALPTLNDIPLYEGDPPLPVKKGDRIRFTSQGPTFVFKSCPSPHTSTPGANYKSRHADPEPPTRADRHVANGSTAILVTTSPTTTIPLTPGVSYPLSSNATLNHRATGWNEETQRAEFGWTLTTSNLAGHRTTVNGDLVPPYSTILISDGDRLMTIAPPDNTQRVVMFHLTPAPAPTPAKETTTQ